MNPLRVTCIRSHSAIRKLRKRLLQKIETIFLSDKLLAKKACYYWKDLKKLISYVEGDDLWWNSFLYFCY